MEEVNLTLKSGSKLEVIKNKGDFLEVRLKMKIENNIDMEIANKKLLEMLAEYYHVPMKRLKIASGLEEFEKVVEIYEEDETTSLYLH